MVSSGVLIAIPGTIPDELQQMDNTITGTPADNFPDAQRKQFCSTSGPQSLCDMCMATTPYDVWFARIWKYLLHVHDMGKSPCYI